MERKGERGRDGGVMEGWREGGEVSRRDGGKIGGTAEVLERKVGESQREREGSRKRWIDREQGRGIDR